MAQNKRLIAVPNAPPCLVRIVGNGPGGKLLTKLLTDNQMDKAWRDINRKFKSDEDSIKRLWQEILFIYRQVHRDTFRWRKKKDDFAAIARGAEDLLKAIDDADFDRLILEFVPAELMDDICGPGVSKPWCELDVLEKHARAAHLLVAWPSIVQVVQGLRDVAEIEQERVSDDAQVYLRERGNDRLFAKKLLAYFFEHLGAKPSSTVARITNSLFETDLTDRQVRDMIQKMPN